jgi:hypothetical protein
MARYLVSVSVPGELPFTSEIEIEDDCRDAARMPEKISGVFIPCGPTKADRLIAEMRILSKETPRVISFINRTDYHFAVSRSVSLGFTAVRVGA